MNSSTAEKVRAIRALPDDAQVPVGWVRELIDGGEPFDGVPTAEAAEILGIDTATGRRKLRRRWSAWKAAMDRGQRPPVRVSRKNPGNPNSDLLFDRADLYEYAKVDASGRGQARRLLEAVE